MMFCRYCGKQIPDDSVFCAFCGNQVGEPDKSDVLVKGANEQDSASVLVFEPVDMPNSVIVTEPATVSKSVIAPVAQKKKRNKTTALIVMSIILIVIAVAVLLVTVIVPKLKYEKAEDLFAAGYYSQAYDMYTELGDYKDSVEKSKECLYIQAVVHHNNKNWDTANSLFEQIADYKDSAALIHYHDHAIVDTKKSTCTDSGYLVYKCDCGDEYTTEIPAGHNYSSATCTAAKKCSRCGKTEGSALGHTSEAKCTRCGKITFETQTYYGSGQDCVSGITLPEGEYNVKFTYYGEGYFAVWFHRNNTLKSLAANVVGSSTCIYRLESSKYVPVENAYFNVTSASGSWSITIEAIG